MSKKPGAIATIKEVIAKTAVPNKTGEIAADTNAPSWIKYVAMLTGVLAALAGFLTVRSTILTNEAIYESNQAILSQTQASDAWSEYQADSIKARIIEMQLLPSSTLNAQDKAVLAKEDEEIRQRQPKSRQLANDKTKERETRLSAGMKLLEKKDVLGYAEMAVQLGIALSSVAALVRKRIAFDVGALIGIIGIALAAYALLF